MSLLEMVMTSLRANEGFRQFPYRDTLGHLTIGYGRNLEKVGVDEIESQYLCRNDVIRTLAAISKIDWFQTLSTARQAVIVEMGFNLGIDGMLQFANMIQDIKDGNYDGAAAEMLNSKWADQVGSRATRLAIHMKAGV